MLTTTDLNKIGGIIDKKLEKQKNEILGTMDIKFENFEVKVDEKFENFKEKMDEKFTQQRSDFFDKIDPVLKEVKANSEERIINDHRIADHEDRITALESTHSSCLPAGR
jgi:hypothetical protein